MRGEHRLVCGETIWAKHIHMLEKVPVLCNVLRPTFLWESFKTINVTMFAENAQMVKGCWGLSYEERLEKLSLFPSHVEDWEEI